MAKEQALEAAAALVAKWQKTTAVHGEVDALEHALEGVSIDDAPAIAPALSVVQKWHSTVAIHPEVETLASVLAGAPAPAAPTFATKSSPKNPRTKNARTK